MDPLVQKFQERLQLLDKVESDSQRLWGLMSPQNLMEHLGGVFYATAKGIKGDIVLDPEVVPKAKARFFSSYYPFPQNVKMPGAEDRPAKAPSLRYASLEEARGKMNAAAQFYLKQLKEQPEQTASHGYFGDLTMNEWLYFHTKHVEHHLQQFGILPRDEKIPELEKLLYKLKTRIQSDTPALWGKMNSQQMVEHLSLVFALSTGKFDFPYQGTEEEAKRNWEGFLASENPWREVFSSDSFGEPKPPRKATLEDSLALLQKSFNGYLDYCEGHPDAIHPQFYLGNLTIDQWRQVHVKHVKHHMRQFGLEV